MRIQGIFFLCASLLEESGNNCKWKKSGKTLQAVFMLQSFPCYLGVYHHNANKTNHNPVDTMV
jgi:hypothetical protein